MSFIFFDNTKKRYVLSYSINTAGGKKRKRLFFKTKKKAIEAKKTHDSSQKEYGRVSNFDLDHYQKLLAIEEYADGIDLVKAIDCYKLSHHSSNAKAIEEVASLYLENKKEINVSPEWIVTLRGYLEKLKLNFRNASIDRIELKDLKLFLSKLPYSISYKDNMRRVMQNFFEFAVDAGWCKSNPAKKLKPYIYKKEEILYVSAKDVSILFKCLEDSHQHLIPFNAIRAFAGMRTSHVKKLSWDDINFEEKGIRVKNRGKSVNDFLQGFPENLWLWLNQYSHLPIYIPNVDRKSGDIIRQLNIEYPRNGFRHAFGTYHVALFKDTALTSFLMQHKGSPRTLHKFYKGVSTEKEGEMYFNTIPKI